MTKTGKFLLFLFAGSLAVWFLVFSGGMGGNLETVFLDVGQGDAVLIKSPEGRTMLIDGGPNNKVLEGLGKYLPALSKNIDVVILTHPHADHVTGLVEVFKRYDIGTLVLSGAGLKSDVYGEFLKTAASKNVPVVLAEAGIAVHLEKDLEFDILSPERAPELVFNKNSESFGAAGGDLNDTSVVGKLIFKDFSILLTGDATSKIENRLLVYGGNLKSGILKAGHHGSKYSSSLQFLKLVSPKAAMIEVGAKNRYGHPAEPALDRLRMIGAEIFRTDLNGDIKVVSDGFTANIFKEK